MTEVLISDFGEFLWLRARRLLGSLLPPLFMPRASMSFEAYPFHSEAAIAQSGHPQEGKWHWLFSPQCHIAVVLYNQISGTSPSIWKLQNWLKLGNLFKCPEAILWGLPSLGEMSQYGLGTGCMLEKQSSQDSSHLSLVTGLSSKIWLSSEGETS